MHNLTKIKIYRLLLRISYLPSLLFIYPFACFRKKSDARLVFLFDRYAIGGAQRIYLDVLKSVEDQPKLLYFTRSSADDKLKQSFYETPRAEIKDIHGHCENLFIRLFSIHYYAFYFNRHKNLHLFSSNSTFFFDLLPFLKKDIIKTELFHNFAYGKNGMEFFGLANYRYLDHRVIYDNLTLSNIRNQYQEYGVPGSYLERLRFLEPGVNIPAFQPKDFRLPIKVLYAGRGGAQKRVWIINNIIEKVSAMQLPVSFYFAGTMTDDLSEFTRTHATILGGISSIDEMYKIYQQSHLLILTSAYEGFPMVIKESMACGCVPLVTALEGNKTHLADHQNALLIEAIDNEEMVAQQAIEHLQYMVNHPVEWQQLSVRCYEYAVQHFSKAQFLQSCRVLLLQNS